MTTQQTQEYNAGVQEDSQTLLPIKPMNKKKYSKARLATLKLFSRQDKLTIKRNYDLIDRLDKGEYDLPFADFFKDSSSHNVREEVIQKYELETAITKYGYPFGPEARWGNRRIGKNRIYTLGLDGPIGLMLTYLGQPAAVVSFAASDPSTLMILQMQAVNLLITDDEGKIKEYRLPSLASLQIRDFLVSCSESIGRQLNFDKIAIRSAHNSSLVLPDKQGRPPHMSLEYALGVYDGTAAKLNFDPGPDRNWYKQLNHQNN